MQRPKSVRAFTAALTLTTMLCGMATEAFAQIEEIVVTTRKREENLQEVPIVVQAFTSDAIERKGITDLSDVAKYTSGVNLDTGFSRQDTRVVIRGLSPTRGRQNVAILQDEVDISSLAQGSAGGSFTINPRLTDVERIEVVKGPHPALFGRSAFSGAINYISKKPGDEFEGNAQVDVGTYNKYEARASVSGPVIADKLSLGLNAAGWTFGGFYDSAVTGHGLGGGDGWGTALSAKFTPNDTLTINARTEYSKDNFDPDARFAVGTTDVTLPVAARTAANGLAAVIAQTSALSASFPQSIGSLGDRDDYNQPAPSRNPRTGKDYPGSDRKIFRTTLRADLETEFATLTSITHYGDNSTFQFNDALELGDFADPRVAGGQETYWDTKTRLLTQEFRAQSNNEGPFKWTVGGLFWNEKLEQDSRSIVCVASGGGCATVFAAVTGFSTPRNIVKRDTHHYSAYGLGEYAITDKLSAEVELRYTVEKEDTSGFGTTSPSFFGCGSASAGVGQPAIFPLRVINADGTYRCVNTGAFVTGPQTATAYNQVEVGSVFWTPRFTLDYKATDDVLIYASAGMGKKPGGLGTIQNTLGTAATNIYDPEEMWAYEVGSKTTWLDGQLVLNGAIYYQDYAKKQVSISFQGPQTASNPSGLTTRVVNAAKASVKGLELDAVVLATDNLSLRASYTYNDGEYEKFEDISTAASAITRANVRNPNNCTVVVIGGANRCILSYEGYRLEGAPKHSLTLGGTLEGDITGDLGWFIDTDVRFQSKRYTTYENSLWMDKYWTVDLRGGVKNNDWSVTAYVNNLFNDDTIKSSAVYLQYWPGAYVTPRNTLYSFGSGVLPDKRQLGVRAAVNF
jgi:outer membrane receptor protein involved in Fe transport